MNKKTANIKRKGFNMNVNQEINEEYKPSIDYSKIKVGLKYLDSALVDVNYFKKVNPVAEKETILRAIKNNDYDTLRLLSDYFYKTSGIYARLCRYMAYIYKYDWMVTPIILNENINTDKVIEGFYKSLMVLDNFNAKKNFGEIALKVVRYGVYYGYRVESAGKTVLQELPIKYCRSRYTVNGKPAVEFNMRYFDDAFSDTTYRMKILKIFPPEFAKGYILYREGKLPVDYPGDQQGWCLLDVEKTVKFNVNGEEAPLLVSITPAILDLEEAKELDRKKMEQQLLKILIQKMPLDKNGELIFDVDEAKALHNNAVNMLQQAIGIDVLTTFADVQVEDVSDRNATSQYDEVSKVERAVFNEAGVSQNQFNTDGNMALEKSIANDESSMYGLLMQFEVFLNELLAPFNKNTKKLQYKAQMLNTSIYNYQNLAKLYGDQMKVGFSKMLPQIALGQSQSSIMATAYFENEILDLNAMFIAPAMSSNISAKGQTSSGGSAGRPELPDDQKSDKTIQNRESMS